MLPGGNQSPYRAPCAGSVLCANGPLYQHSKSDEKNIEVFLYDTTVCDWTCCDSESDPNCEAYTDCGCGTIAPYERWAVYDSGADCTTPCQENSNCTEPPCQPCGPWEYTLADPAPEASFYQPQMVTAIAVQDGGSGYEVGDVVVFTSGTTSAWRNPLPGGSNAMQATFTVSAVSNTGAVTGITITNAGSYDGTHYSLPGNPVTLTSGHGTGATVNLTWANQTENISPCQKIGYKNVQALRQWHGAPGYFFNKPEGNYYCDTCNFEAYTAYSNTASQTKYLALNITAYFEVYSDYDFVNGGTINIDLSVDPTSGVITNASSASGSPSQCNAFDPGNGYPSADDILNALSQTDANGLLGYFLSDIFLAAQSGDTLTCSEGSYQDTSYLDNGDVAYQVTITWSFTDDGLTISGTDGIISANATLSDSSLSFSYSSDDGEGDTVLTTLSVTLSSPNTPDDVQADIVTLLDEWDLTDDATYPWRTDYYTSIAPLVTRNEAPGPVNPFLFGAFTASDTYLDTCYEQVAASDPNALLYDGSILGSPLPAGYQGYFDFNFNDYQWCADASPAYGYINGYGQQNQGQNGIPLTATQWTPNNLAWGLPGGAWIFYNLNPSWGTGACTGGSEDGGDGYTYSPPECCIAQKWAETKVAWPSQNFARPCGNDRFLYDETQVYAVTAISGSGEGAQVTLVACDNCGVEMTLETGASCSSPTVGAGLWGGPAVGGFYKIASQTDNVVTLGELVYNVPDNWQSASNDNDNCFGLLRWSTGDTATDPPPIQGRAAISAVAQYDGNANVSELTTDGLPNLGQSPLSADAVDIYDSLMNLLASNLAVTRVSDTQFTVPVAPGTLAGAAWIMSHGAPAYYWNDQYPKGDFVYTDWTWWPRLYCEAVRINNLIAGCPPDDLTGCGCSALGDTQTVYCFPFSAFTQEASCVPFTPCNPSVLCCSPNGESFSAGVTYSFPTIEFDEQYGSGWQQQFQQVMVDLFYQGPHFPAWFGIGDSCIPDDFAWSEDDGTCNSNTTGVEYYPLAPYVEARLTVPSGAPALPGSIPSQPCEAITIGWQSPVDYDVSGCSPPADMLLPPNSNGSGLGGEAVWYYWLNMCACIASDGDFAATYGNQAINCSS